MFFPARVAARAASFGGFGAQAVDHRRRGGDRSTDPLAFVRQEMMVDRLEDALLA
jgi:hypothetical protein